MMSPGTLTLSGRIGIDGLHDLSRVQGTIKYKVDTATEETILDLREELAATE